jgi:hypothetical protein
MFYLAGAIGSVVGPGTGQFKGAAVLLVKSVCVVHRVSKYLDVIQNPKPAA